jgi:hypothetical protein
VLQIRVDSTRPLAWGFPARVDVFFDESPVFDLSPGAFGAGVRPVAWFDSARSLRSGWAWGQERLERGVAVAEAAMGEQGGRLLLFGPEILNRGQSHGTFHFFFNAIQLTGATAGGPAAASSEAH